MSASLGSKRESAVSTTAITESINELLQTMKDNDQLVITRDGYREFKKDALQKLTNFPIFHDNQNMELGWWAYWLLGKKKKQ